MPAPLSARRLRWIFALWPPFRCAGIRVLHIGDDFRSARVRLRAHWFNRNYVGTHFGGSLFAMTDPFWMLLVMHGLGRDYIVWDKAGEIEFVAPGRGDVFAEFHLQDAVLDELRAATRDGAKALRWFDTEVTAADGTLIARVRKQLYVRRKRPRTGEAPAAAPARLANDDSLKRADQETTDGGATGDAHGDGADAAWRQAQAQDSRTRHDHGSPCGNISRFDSHSVMPGTGGVCVLTRRRTQV